MSSSKKKAAKKATKTAAKKATKKAAVKKQSTTNSKSRLRSVGAAPQESTTLDTLYIITESANEVTLAIQVGDKGQTSNMTIRLDNQVIVQNHSGDLATTSLGSNKSLNGKKLGIVATIADTSRETNMTSLKIQLKGGMDANEYPLSKTVDEEGASADYICLIEFYKP